MKEEIKRIMVLVKEGKLSPEDAAELIDAFSDSGDEEEPIVETHEAKTEAPKEEPKATTADAEPNTGSASTEAKTDNPFASFLDMIEKVGKDVTKNVDWNNIADQVRTGVGKGVEAIKQAADEHNIKGFFGSEEVKVVELPLEVPAGKTLRIEGSSGKISVLGSDELGSLRASATFRAYNIEEAKKKALIYSPVIEENEQFVTIKLQDGPDSTVDANITIKPDVTVEVKHASGSISIRDIKAPVRVNSASSSVSMSGIDGAVEVVVASGDVQIMDCKGPALTLETKSGDVKVKNVTGSISLRTSSGEADLRELYGKTLSVEAASGDVSAELVNPVDGSVHIRAVSGDVKLEIADGSDAKVTISTLQGVAASKVALEDMAQESMKVSGRLGKGAGTIDLSTVSGDVTLMLRDSTVQG